MADPKLVKLHEEYRRLSDRELEYNTRIDTQRDAVIAPAESLFWPMLEAVRQLPLGHPAAKALADRVLGSAFLQRFMSVKSNPASFMEFSASFYAEVDAVYDVVKPVIFDDKIENDVRLSITSLYRRFRVEVSRWPQVAKDIAGLFMEYRSAIEAKNAKRVEIEAFVERQPEARGPVGSGEVGTATRFSRKVATARIGRVCDDATAMHMDWASFSRWGPAVKGFYYFGSELDGCKTAQAAMDRLGLQYKYYNGKAMVAVEFEVSASFLQAHGAVEAPSSREGWLKVLNRLGDSNHDYGQATAAGGGAEKVLLNPLLENVRPRAPKYLPWDDSKASSQKQDALAKASKEQLEKQLADATSRIKSASKERVDALRAMEVAKAAAAAARRAAEAAGANEAALKKAKQDLNDAGKAYDKARWAYLGELDRETAGLRDHAYAFEQLHGRPDAASRARLQAILDERRAAVSEQFDRTIAEKDAVATKYAESLGDSERAKGIRAHLATCDKKIAEARTLQASAKTIGEYQKAVADEKAALAERNQAYYQVHGKYDPDIRKRLTALELAATERSIAEAKKSRTDPKAPATAAEDVKNLERQRKQLLAERELKKVRGEDGKRVAGIMTQANRFEAKVGADNSVSGLAETSVYVHTPGGNATGGKSGDESVGVPGTSLRFGVTLDEAKTQQTGGGELHPVHVAVTASGVAGVLPGRPDAIASSTAAHLGARAKATAGNLPAKAAEPFPNVIGRLVEANVQRLFHGTASRVHVADGGTSKVAPADPLRPMAGAFVKGPLAPQHFADRVMRRAEISKFESLITTQVARLDAATDESAGLVSNESKALTARLAILDAQLDALRGKGGKHLAEGARGVGMTLGQMASIARSLGLKSEGTLRTLQHQMEARRDALARLASGLPPEGKARPEHHRNLDEVRTKVPGLDKVVGKKKVKPGEEARDKSARNKQKAATKKQKANARRHAEDDDATDRGVLGKKARKGKKLPTGGLEALARAGRRGPGKGRSGARTTGVLEKAQRGFQKQGRSGLVDAIAPGALKAFGALKPTVSKLLETLRMGGHTPRKKSWFESIKSGISNVKKGVSQIDQGVGGGLSALAKTAVKYSPIGLAVHGVQKGMALAKTVVQASPIKSLANIVTKGAGALVEHAKKAASSGMNLVKKTAVALGEGVKKVGGAIGEAAAKSWDATKHVVKVIGNGASAIANKTGGFLKGLWTKATGVVGAIGGKVKSGLSSLGNWVGEKAKKVGGTLLNAAKGAGKAFLKHHPLGQALKWGWDKFGKKAWDKTKSLAKVAWEGAKKVGKAAGTFLQSPAGQLLTTGLSVAASFIPGGMLVKAGIGAVVGAIEAVSKGGGWKEALIGAATGGLEGALPFMKLGAVGKMAISGVKGGLQAAAEGKGLGDIAKGALGGALQTGALGLVTKFGGGKGIKLLDGIMSGKGPTKGVLGKIGKVAQNGALQKIYGGVKKVAPKIVKGAVWAYDKSGKLHKVLDAVNTGGEFAKGALEGIGSASGWLSEKLGEDSKLGGFVKKIGDLSNSGAEKLGTGLEYVKKVDEVVSTAHDYLGKGLEYVGVDPSKAAAEMNRKRALKKKLGEKAGYKPTVFDRTEDFLRKRYGKVDEKFKSAQGGLQKQVKRFKAGVGRSEAGRNMIKAGRSLVKAGMWTYGQLGALKETIDRGVAAGESIQGALQDLVLLTDGADAETLGGSLKWINDTAADWESKLEGGLKLAKQVQGYTDTAHEYVGTGLKKVGKSDEELEAKSTQAKVWYGLERPEEGKKTVKAGLGAKVGEDEVAVSGFVKTREAIEEKVLGSSENPTKVRRSLERLDKWRETVKTGAAAVGAKLDEVTAGNASEDESDEQTLLGRARAGTRLLGGEAGQRDAEWEARKGRVERGEEKQKKAKAGAAAPEATGNPAAVQGELKSKLGDAIGKKLGEVGEKQAGEVASLEQKDPGAASVHVTVQQQGPTSAPASELDDAEGGDAGPNRGNTPVKEAFVRGALPLQAEQAEQTDQGPGALEQLADEEGIAGGQPEYAQPALEELVQGGAATGPGPESDVVFERLSQMVGSFDARVAAELPQLVELVATNPKAASGAYTSLVGEGRRSEAEIERLGNIVGGDPQLARGLGTFVRRYMALRGQVEHAFAHGALQADPETTDDATGAAGPAGDGAPEQELVAGAAEAEGAEGEGAAGEGATGTGAALGAAGGGADPEGESLGMDEGYLGEDFQDTYIGSGAAARPIQDGLESGFKFEDSDGAEPSLGAAFAKLGGAVQGLGASAGGLAGDVGELVGTTKEAFGVLGDIGGTLGGLVGKKDNALTKFTGKAGTFLDGVQKGAGEFGQLASKFEKYGAKANEFGHEWDKKGLGGAVMDRVKSTLKKHVDDAKKSIGIGEGRGGGAEPAAPAEAGQAFMKVRPGTATHEGRAPMVDTRDYVDAPKRLDYSLQHQMERFLGTRLGSVKIHTGAGAALVTKRFDAEAVTIRDHVFFAPGRFQPETTEGRKLIAHELTHVAQRGRANLDTRTAETEAHRAEASFGTPGMEVLDLSTPKADFHLNMAGAESGPAGIRTAKKQRSVGGEATSHDDGIQGEDLLDLVGERVYQLMLDDLEKEHESR